MSKGFIIAVILMLVMSFTALAEEENLTGKDFVRLGSLDLISGTLLRMDGEWFVQTEDELYEIHLGDHDYRDENIQFEMEEGQEVNVVGYVYGDDVSVVIITLSNYSYQCRDIMGKPLWAGQGRGTGSGLTSATQGEGLGAGGEGAGAGPVGEGLGARETDDDDCENVDEVDDWITDDPFGE